MSGSPHNIAALDARSKLDGFIRALSALRRGQSTPAKVQAELDRILADGELAPIDLLATLIQEDANDPLPTQVFEAIEKKLKIDDHWDAAAEERPSNLQPQTQSPDQHTGPAEAKLATSNGQFKRRYKLIEHTGSGQISIILRAIDRTKAANDPGKYVTIEAVRPEFGADKALLAALESEANGCRELIHPNIAEVFSFRRGKTTAQIASEYFSGESLAQKLRFGRIAEWTTEQILDVVDEIGQALVFAHARGLVHGGITPDKIFITQTGRLKVTDFVISRAMRAVPSTQGMLANAYTSPEMLAQQAPDPRDDVYSLACMTYELLIGIHPFARARADEAHRQQRRAARIPRLNHWQWRALNHGLAFKRNERTPTVARFLREFNAQVPSWHYAMPAAAVLGIVVLGGAFFWSYSHDTAGLKSLADDIARLAQLNEPAESKTPTPETSLASARLEPAAPEPVSSTPEPAPDVEEHSMTAQTGLDNEPAQRLAQTSEDVSQEIIATPLELTVESIETESEAANLPEQASTVTPAAPQKASENAALLTRASPTSEDDPLVAVEPTQEPGEPADEDDEVSAAPLETQTAEERARAENEQRVAALMIRASRQFTAQHYTTPEGDAAFETYQRILQISPDHEGALEGIAAIKAQYMEWGKDAIAKEQWERAERNFDKVLKIDPEDPAALAALERLEKKQAEHQANLQQEQLEEEALVEIIDEPEQLLIRARDQLAADHLTRPRGDSAWDLFARVLSIDSENQEARAGLSTIMERLEANATQKYNEGKLRTSLAIVLEGLRVFPSHTGLQALRQDIRSQLGQTGAER